MKNQKLSRE